MKTARKVKMGIGGIVFCAILALATSCDLNQEQVAPDPVAYVSLYQASPNAPDLAIEVDGRRLNMYPFDYTDHTGYLRFYTGTRNLKFGPFGANNIVIDTTVTLENMFAYSIFVVDEFENASLLILNDNADAPAEGKAKVRFINVSPDANEVDLRIASETSPLIQDVSFKQASAFIEVDADESQHFQVTRSNNDDVLLELPDITFQSGTFYTILVRGYRTPPAGNTNVLSGEIVLN